MKAIDRYITEKFQITKDSKLSSVDTAINLTDQLKFSQDDVDRIIEFAGTLPFPVYQITNSYMNEYNINRSIADVIRLILTDNWDGHLYKLGKRLHNVASIDIVKYNHIHYAMNIIINGYNLVSVHYKRSIDNLFTIINSQIPKIQQLLNNE